MKADTLSRLSCDVGLVLRPSTPSAGTSPTASTPSAAAPASFDQVQVAVATSTAANTAVARLVDGRSVVVWLAQGNRSAMGRFIDSAGNPAGNAFPLPSGAPNAMFISQVTAAPALDGGFAIARVVPDPTPCCAGSPTGGTIQIHVDRYAGDGTQVSSRSVTSLPSVGPAKVRMNADGTYALGYLFSSTGLSPSQGSVARLGADGSRLYGGTSSPAFGIFTAALGDGGVLRRFDGRAVVAVVGHCR
jgi:hypothetical protein